jgi:UDP-glucose 4-epimerase
LQLKRAPLRPRGVLGWTPRYSELSAIIETAWRWHRAPAF